MKKETGTNKVSITMDRSKYHKLSEYSQRFGTSVKFMIEMMIDDMVKHDRYLDIFAEHHSCDRDNDKALNDIVSEDNTHTEDVELSRKLHEEQEETVEKLTSELQGSGEKEIDINDFLDI
jgi:hypothetical protein